MGLAEGGSSADIPPRMLEAYKKAVRLIGSRVPHCRGMRWPVLAGIAKVESNHASGRDIASDGDIRPKIYGVLLNGSGAGGNTSVFTDTDGGKWDGTATGERAVGPFQFMPATWESTGQDGNRDRVRDPHNADDAALGAAAYLCGRGRNLGQAGQLRAAIFQYNHSNAYVANVMKWIDQYTAAARSGGSAGLMGVKGKARTVLQAALAQRGCRTPGVAAPRRDPQQGRAAHRAESLALRSPVSTARDSPPTRSPEPGSACRGLPLPSPAVAGASLPLPVKVPSSLVTWCSSATPRAGIPPFITSVFTSVAAGWSMLPGQALLCGSTLWTRCPAMPEVPGSCDRSRRPESARPLAASCLGCGTGGGGLAVAVFSSCHPLCCPAPRGGRAQCGRSGSEEPRCSAPTLRCPAWRPVLGLGFRLVCSARSGG